MCVCGVTTLDIVVVPKRAGNPLGGIKGLEMQSLLSLTFDTSMASEDFTAHIETLSVLSEHEIQKVLDTTTIHVAREQRKPKAAFVQHVVKVAPSHILLELLRQAGAKKKRRRDTQGKAHISCKRARQEVETSVEEICKEGGSADEEDDDTNFCPGFLQRPTPHTMERCYAQFYRATSNTALDMCVCGICGRGCVVQEDRVTLMPLSLMPNSHRLIPTASHVAHELFQGKLLEPAGLTVGEEDPIVNVCGECMQELNKSRDVPPKLALANRMWVGKVPWELQVLTFPEQLLIALLYPWVYVFKLFPKRQMGAGGLSNLQRGMRGNVSTYQMNMDAIASMIEGKMMPRPPSILASLITITFVAAGKIPKAWLHTTFRVRRAVVMEALLWLKHNNMKYYGDIQINAERLAHLPEDDVPEEIHALVRQTEDVGVLDEESDDGYVPKDNNEGVSESLVWMILL